MSKYDDIMQYLNPKRFIEEIEVPHDNIRAGCVIQSSIVRTSSEFRDLITAYVAYHMEAFYGLAPEPCDCLAKAKNFLDASIKFETAIANALSGSDGGMVNILNMLSEGFKNEAKKNYFGYIIDTHIDYLSFDEKVELMREFKEKLGRFAPDSFQLISPEEMASTYKEIFWNYLESLKNNRHLWRYY